jgi:hypothetical protein
VAGVPTGFFSEAGIGLKAQTGPDAGTAGNNPASRSSTKNTHDVIINDIVNILSYFLVLKPNRSVLSYFSKWTLIPFVAC